MREQVAKLGDEYDINPWDGLLKAVRLSWGGVYWCNSKVNEIEESYEQAKAEGDTDAMNRLGKMLVAFQKVYGEWIDRATNTSALAIKAGIEERRVRIEEQQADQFAEAIKGILADLNLTEEQQAMAPQLVKQHILALSAA